MVETRFQENSRMMDERIQTTEQKFGMFEESNENKMWLRQKGCLKEFNAFFDEATSNVQLPERYLVMTYVAGLKREIAESVKLFNPLTMREARLLARSQEISLQWRARKAAQARKVLAGQEGPVIPKASDEGQEEGEILEKEDEILEPVPTQDTGDDEGFKSSVPEKETESKDAARITQDAIRKNEDNMEVTGNMLGVDRCSSFDTLRSFQTSSSASSLSTLPLSASMASSFIRPTITVLLLHQSSTSLTPSLLQSFNRWSLQSNGNPYSHVSRSMDPGLLDVQTWTWHAKIQFGLSNSLLFIMDSSAHEFSRVERGVSKKKNEDTCGVQLHPELEILDLGFTWLNKVELEESNVQLDTTLFNLQKYLGGSQLDNVLFPCQKYFADSLGFLIADGHLGFEGDSKYMSPLTLHLGFKRSECFNDGLLQKWLTFSQRSPTQGQLQNWFRGDLIRMLVGSGLDFLLLFVPASNK